MILDPLAILWMAFFVAVAFLAGDLFTGKLLQDEKPFMRGMINVALGYGIIGFLLIFFGQCGRLRPIPVTLLFLSLILVRFVRLKELFSWICDVSSVLWRRAETVEARLFQWILLFLMGATFLFCFLPEIAHDSLVYHINLPKLYVQTGSIRTNPYDLMSFRPLLLECLYSLAFLWKCLPLAKLIHWWTGILLTLGLIRIIDEKTGSYRLAVFSGLVLFSTPLFINEIQTTYTDVGTAFFSCLSLYLFLRAMETCRRSLYLFSGILMGLAVSTKLLTAIMAVAVVLSFVACRLGAWRKYKTAERRETLAPLLIYGAGLLLAYGYWIVRNAMITGNPFFPYFASFFPGLGIPLEQEFIQEGVSKTIFHFLLLPFLVTFSPDSFDRHHYIGPIYLLALPFFIYGAFKSEKVRLAAIASFLFFAIWFYLCQNDRFLSTVLPLFLYGGIWGFSRWQPIQKFSKVLRAAGVGLAFLALSCSLGLFVFHFRDHLKALVSGSSPQHYLSSMERTFDIAAWVNSHLSKDAKILSLGEIRAFYFDRSFVGGDVYSVKNPEAFSLSGEALVKLFRKQGFSHLLVCSPVDSEKGSAGLFRPLEKVIGKENGLKEIFHMLSKNQREPQCLYRVFELTCEKTGEGLI